MTNEKRWTLSVLGGLLLIIGGSVLSVRALDRGRIDPFYLRFTTPRQSSLVLGTSRAAQGIVPAAFNDGSIAFEGPLFNFAFTNNTSRPGPAYYRTVRKKLDKRARTGLFIVEVSPRSLGHASPPDAPPNAPDLEQDFIEGSKFVAQMEDVTSNPNYEYLWNHYAERYLTLLYYQFRKPTMLVHDDGWLDVRIAERRGRALKERIRDRLKATRRSLVNAHISPVRLRCLAEMAILLAQHGTVFVVRLPTSPEMRDLENELYPTFDQTLQQVLAASGAEYLSFLSDSEDYVTNDGAHLHRSSARRFSARLAAVIKGKLGQAH